MTLRLKALRSLRWNYRWRGVWAWLTTRQNRWLSPYGVIRVDSENRSPYGWQRILSEPDAVLAEQTQLAEGVFA